MNRVDPKLNVIVVARGPEMRPLGRGFESQNRIDDVGDRGFLLMPKPVSLRSFVPN